MNAVPAAVAILGLSVAARAQPAGTGRVAGRVVDAATHAALPGAAVEVADPARGWSAPATTDRDGRYVVAALVPGWYVVRVRAGAATVVRARVRVDAGGATEIDEAIGDARGTRIDAAVAEPLALGTTVLGRRYLDDLPRTTETIDGVMGAAPGARSDGYGVSYGGASALENRYDLDGLDTTGLVYAGVGARIPDELVDQLDVITAGAGPALDGAEGGFVAVTTRHGTNELHGGVYAAFAPAALAGRPNAVTTTQVLSVATRPGDTVDLAADVGGPIVRDRAWFYVAVAPQLARADQVRTISRRTDCRVVQDGALSPCDPRNADGVPDVDPRTGQLVVDPVDSEIRTATSDAYTVLGRVDVAPAAGQQGSLTVLATPRTGTLPGVDGLASTGTRDWELASDVAARWTAALDGGALELDAGLGWHRDRYDTGSIDPALDATPQQVIEGGDLGTLAALGGESAATARACHDGGAGDPAPDLENCPVSAYAIGGPGIERHELDDRRTAHLAATARVHAAGLHEVTAGVAGELDAARDVSVISGGTELLNFGSSAEAVTDVRLAPAGSTDPAFDGTCEDGSTSYRCQRVDGSPVDPTSHARIGAAYLRDRWHAAPGLVLDVGARYTAQQLELAPAVAGTVDPISGQRFPRTLLDVGLVEPRLGVSFDPTGLGRATVFAHWGRYGETVLDNLATRFTGVASYEQVLSLASCPVDPRLGVPDATRCATARLSGSIFGAAPTRAAPGLRAGYVDELVVGGAVEPADGLVLGATLQDRRLGRAIEDTEDAAGDYVLVNPGESPAQGRVLDRPERRYDALALTIARRFARLYVLASYTYSRDRGNDAGDISYGNGQVDPHQASQYDLPQLDANRFGPLPEDRPHLFDLDAAYTQPLGRATALVVGGRLRVASGVPVLTLGADALSGPDEIYLLPPGALGRTPTAASLDAHLAVRHRFARAVTLEVFADVANLFDDQTAFGVDPSYAPVFYSGGSQATRAISGGSYADLIWAKQLDAVTSVETNRPIGRNPQFGKPTSWYTPIAARFGLRLTF